MGKSRIGGLHLGDMVRFTSQSDPDKTVCGRVTELRFGLSQCDYADVVVDADSFPVVFGTGGHLGEQWTTDGETGELWTVEVVIPA